MKTTKLCGFDLETPQEIAEWGLQPWRVREGATIKSVAWWVDDDLNAKIQEPSVCAIKDFLVVAALDKWTLVGWNVAFDIAWLHAIGLSKEVNACTWMDAMLLLKRVDGWRSKELGGTGYGLKATVARRWPEHADYGLGDAVTKVPSTDDEWRVLLDYNLLDSKFTCLLAREYLALLTPSEQKSARQEALGIPPIALSAINGIHINREALEALNDDVAARRSVSENILGVPEDIIASPAKLGRLLFDTWGLAPTNYTPKGKPSTDKEALLTLELEHPEDTRFKHLMALRKCNTQQAKFVDAVYESMKYHGENVTRPGPIIAGTYSGRLTYGSKQGKGKTEVQTGIALHQWERGKAARNILEAPAGFLLAEFDASGQEARLMADASQDATMLKLFNSDGDIHAYTGAAIEGVDYEWLRQNHGTDIEAKRIRNLGKFCVLSSQYRIGTDTLRVRALTQYGLNLTYERAKHISDSYRMSYPGVIRYWQDAISRASSVGYAESRGHRRIAIKNIGDYGQQQTAINFPIQATGADMKTLAIAVLQKTEFNDDVIYAWDLHDALFLYIRDDGRALETVKRIRMTLGMLPYQAAWGWTPSIALPWDASFGKSWGTLKGVEK